MSNVIGHIATVTKYSKLPSGEEYTERTITGRILSDDTTFMPNGELSKRVIIMEGRAYVSVEWPDRQRITIEVED